MFWLTVYRYIGLHYHIHQLGWWRVRRRRTELLQDLPPTTDWRANKYEHSCSPLDMQLDPCWRRLLVTPGNPRRIAGRSTYWSWKLVGWGPRWRSDARTLHQLQQLYAMIIWTTRLTQSSSIGLELEDTSRTNFSSLGLKEALLWLD